MREFISPPQNHVWEMNQKIQKIEQNLNTLTTNQDIPLKLRKIGDHEYKLYVDLNADQLSQLKNNPNSSIMGIQIDLSPMYTSMNDKVFFNKYSYSITNDNSILLQSICIDYNIPSDITVSYNILNENSNWVFYKDISNKDYTASDDDLFNLSDLLKLLSRIIILQYFNIEDGQASITNLIVKDLTTGGTYIIKTGSTSHTITNLDSVIKFPEGKPTFEVNKTYILKVTYDATSGNYYCTDVKSFSNT